MPETIYSFPAEGSQNRPFSLQMAGISHCDASYRIQRFASPIYVFEYVTSGKGTVRLREKVFHPQAGDIYILHRGMDHDYYSDPKAPWTKLWFNVEGPLLNHLFQVYGLSEVYHVRQAGQGLFRLFKEGLREVKKHHRRLDKSGVHEIMALFILRIMMALAGMRHAPPENETVRQVKAYIHGRLDRPISLLEISRVAGRSPSQTIRLFKQETGLTPYNYLLNRRIDEAKLYLRDTALSLKTIADKLSFCDEFYFSAYFKRRTGLSPSAFKRT